jgi:hypothetical protein
MLSPAEEWMVDPNLIPLGTDPRYPSTDQIVIPRGRIVAVRPDTSSYTGRAVITLADGVSNHPQGYSEVNIFRQWQEKEQWMCNMNRQDFIELPYVQAINGAYGTLAAGQKITAYYGSATSTNPVPNDKGKVVGWVEKNIYCQNVSTPSNTVNLLSANYPAFTPVIIFAMNTGVVIATGAALSWNATLNCWTATFGDTVGTVVYSFGQGPAQIAGEVIRIEPISSAHHLSGWLEWVTDNFLAWEYPPQLLRVPATAVNSEVPLQVGVNWYRLSNVPIAPWITATVTVTGSQVNPDGSVTALNGTVMSTSDMPMVDYTMGQYYNINSVTGDLYFSNNIIVNAVTVSYSFETSYRDGRLFNPGVIGLTDGTYSGVPGTPANLEIAGVIGSLRCIIY